MYLKNPKKNIVFNLLIYITWFMVVYYYRRGVFEFTAEYIYFILAYIASWLLAALISRKHRPLVSDSLFESFRPYIAAFFLMMGIISLISILLNWTEISRIVVTYSLILSLLTEVILVALTLKKYKNFTSRSTYRILKPNFFINFFILLFNIIYVISNHIIIDDINSPHLLLIAGVIVNWFLSYFVTTWFIVNGKEPNFWQSIWSYLKSYILFFVLTLFLTFILRSDKIESIIIYELVGIYSIMSFIVITIFLLSKRGSGSDEIHHKIIKATTYLDIEHLGNGANYEEGYSPSKPSSGAGLSQKLKNVYLSTFPRVYTFLENILNLDSFDMFRSVVIRSSDIYNVDVQPEGEIQLFINLHPLNDIRYLNQYFITLNKKLMQGGVFVGRFEPIKFRHKRFLDSYPYYLAQFFYFFDFIIRRVLPKLPVFKKIYFAITKGKNRAIPLAEGLGRLYYCGYEIIDVKEIDNYIFFAAKRMRVPATDSNPSYGLLFKMKRIGKDGKNLFVYKFRTMHPYSEYLQKFIYEKFSLQEGGKIKNDFRITSWGRIIRKLWIDELPMLLNWLKGELKLVGVRPLSSHYMSLYPQDLIQLRTKYKPGLVPPFYVDLPKTLDEIVASEKKYLNLYEQNPLLTDIKYFFKSFYNILIKNARSN